MKHIAATAALALFAVSGPALAQTAPAAAPGPAAAPQPLPVQGLSAAAISAWLATQGATAEPVNQEGERRYMRVTSDGLPWILYLQSCEGDLCSDLQFAAGLGHAQVTVDRVNTWNRERRFVKAVYEPADGSGPPSAVAQYDVLVPPGGPEELTDALAIWRNLLPEFVRAMVGTSTPAPTAPTAPTAPGG